MAASDDLIAALATAAQAAAERGVSRFRQNDSSADFHTLNEYSNLLKVLSDEEVQRMMNNANGVSIRKFRPIGCS